MHDWPAMRKTWQDNRDGMKVPKGAGKTSIGDAIKRVSVAQPKGLKPFVAELTKLDASLKLYKATIVKNKKYQPFAAWIGNNIEKWVKDDKASAESESAQLTKAVKDLHQAQLQARVGLPTATQDLLAAADASARAQSKPADSAMSLALVKEDAARIGDVFKDWLTALAEVGKICDRTAKLYGQNSTITVATKLAALSSESTDFKTKILAMAKRKTWGDVLSEVRVLESDAKVWMSALDDVRPAAAARIGA
jgi:hypothetical protein